MEYPDLLPGMEPVYLWKNTAVGPVDDTHTPFFSVHLPENPTGAGVVVCPGGAYAFLSLEKEGLNVAQWLNARGVAAFVLHYRLGPQYNHPTQLGDIQRAIRMIRANSSHYGVDPGKLGVCGFSAGGHLASSAATIFDAGHPSSPDAIEQESSRPDFAILAYPVITLLDPYTHVDSRNHLLGESADDSLIREMSTETRVTPKTPPIFLFHTDEDGAVPSENSVQFYLACRKAGVPAELHVYAPGGHGVGLAQEDPVLVSWTNRLEAWMQGMNLLGG